MSFSLSPVFSYAKNCYASCLLRTSSLFLSESATSLFFRLACMKFIISWKRDTRRLSSAYCSLNSAVFLMFFRVK